MTRINSSKQLPQLFNELRNQKFYGQIHLVFRAGQIARMITEQSQVFDIPTQRMEPDDEQPSPRNSQ
jgi:hypothetical protein